VLKNLTLSVDEDVLREARKVALDRNTSVNQLVRDYLKQLAGEKERQKQEAAQRKLAQKRLEKIFRESRVKIGPITWTRDDLYER